MSTFTKTLIVDLDYDEVPGQYYKTIRNATKYFITQNSGGTIYVESGEYEIDGTNINGLDKQSVEIPSNVTLIGRGNVIVKVTNPNQNAFRNYHINDGVNKDDHITLSGFKIIVACGNNGQYNNHLIFMQNVSNSRFEKLTIDAPIEDNPIGVDPSTYAILIYSRDHDCRGNIITQCMIKRYGYFNPGLGFYNYGNGIGFQQHAGTSHICCDSVVMNNHISNCFFNLTCTNAERLTIKDNIITRATGQTTTNELKQALNISLGLCKNIIVSGNQLNETDSTTGSHGLYPSGCEGVIISGNVVCNNGGDGIKPRYYCTEYEDDHVTCKAGHAIHDTNYVIMGNVCNENGQGQYGGVGIHLQGFTDRMSICANICVHNTHDGIRLQAEKSGAATENLVVGNIAILHGGDPGDDMPISIEDPSNDLTNNYTEP